MELLLSQLQNGSVHSLVCHVLRWQINVQFHHHERLEKFLACPTLPPHALMGGLWMGMVECIYRQVTNKVKNVVHGGQFININ